MNLNDLLGHILQRLDMMEKGANIFTADEVDGWPEGALDFFVNQRLLSPTTPDNSLECDGCEERCFRTVIIPPPDAPITRRPFIICNQRDDVGRVIVDLDRLKRWQVDLGRLAGVLSDLLGIDQTPHELICHRLWDLGKVDLESGMSEVFLARGLDWTDAEETLGNDLGLKEAVAPLVFTPGRTSRRFLPHALIFSLTRMLRIQKDHLALDSSGIAIAMAEKAKREVLTGNVFRKAGQFWTISYEGKTFSLQDSRGLQYLAFLLASPGEEFHAQRIQSEVEGKFPSPGYSEATKMSEQNLVEDGLKVSSLGDAGPSLDRQAIREYRNTLHELEEEREEALGFNDFARAEALEDKIEAIKKELISAVGLRGRTRKGADPNEKARKAISKAVGRALDHIKADDLNLWGHLQNALSLGTFPSYKPHPLVIWTN